MSHVYAIEADGTTKSLARVRRKNEDRGPQSLLEKNKAFPSIRAQRWVGKLPELCALINKLSKLNNTLEV